MALLEGMQYAHLLKQAIYADPVPGFKPLLLKSVATFAKFGPALYPTWLTAVTDVTMEASQQGIPIFQIIRSHFQHSWSASPGPKGPSGGGAPVPASEVRVPSASTLPSFLQSCEALQMPQMQRCHYTLPCV